MEWVSSGSARPPAGDQEPVTRGHWKITRSSSIRDRLSRRYLWLESVRGRRMVEGALMMAWFRTANLAALLVLAIAGGALAGKTDPVDSVARR